MKRHQSPEYDTITVPTRISKERVRDLLSSAFEGGANYWYMIEDWRPPTDPKFATEFRHLSYPTSPDGAVYVSNGKEEHPSSPDYKCVRLDWEHCKRTLTLMAVARPTDFADWLEGNDDGDTGDVFLQLAVMGEIVYG